MYQNLHKNHQRAFQKSSFIQIWVEGIVHIYITNDPNINKYKRSAPLHYFVITNIISYYKLLSIPIKVLQIFDI